MNKKHNLIESPQPTTKRRADVSGADFYPTPEWATYALIDNEDFTGDIWECACGDGSMSKILKKTNNQVISSDLYDRGYGESGVNFIKSDKICDNIVTNPPYNLAEDFVTSGFNKTNKKLALLLRLAFLEGVGRTNRLFSIIPPSRVWVFSERITFYPKGAIRKGTGTTAYAWFIWDKSYFGDTKLYWLKPIYKNNY